MRPRASASSRRSSSVLYLSWYVSGAWTTTSPVAGPMRPNDGVKFAYYDSTGTVTATAALVRSIGITVRGLSSSSIQSAGHAAGAYSDSLTVRVAVRNN